MVVPSAGSVVLVPFPFSDLSQSKLRSAVVLADAGRGDWILNDKAFDRVLGAVIGVLRPSAK